MRVLVTWSLLLLQVACGDHKPGAINQPIVRESRNQRQDADGNFVIRGQLFATVDLPIVGRKSRLSTWWSLASITTSDTGPQLVETYCRIDIGSAGPVSQVMDDSVARSIPAFTVPLRLWEESGALRFERDWSATVVGARLNDTNREELPQAPEDERVWDQDQDGKPAVTVHVRSPIGNGDVFIVKRFNNQYSGTVASNGNLRGVVKDNSDQEVIGATNARLKVNPPTIQHTDLSKSPVLIVKTAEAYDCDKLIAEKDRLFPRQEIPNPEFSFHLP